MTSLTPSFARENLQRVGILARVPQLIEQFGKDPAGVVAAAGLTLELLKDPDGSIPLSMVGHLLQVAARSVDCPHFGLELVKNAGTASAGLLGQLMRNALTVGDAFRHFATHQHRNAHGTVVYVLADHQRVLFGYGIYQKGVAGSDHIYDIAARTGFNMVCELLGENYKSGIEVLLSRAKPQDESPYRRAFGLNLRFNAEQTAISLPRRLADLPIPGADAELRKSLLTRIGSLWIAGELDTPTALRRILRAGLVGGSVSEEQVAAEMGMSRRTLHRRLDTYGLRFRDVLDQTRHAYAQQLLAGTELDIGTISTTVGYADPSVFSRAFVRWTGLPPKKWRDRGMSPSVQTLLGPVGPAPPGVHTSKGA